MPKPKEFDTRVNPSSGMNTRKRMKRNKTNFATLIDPDLYERLKAASFWEDTSIAEIVGVSVGQYLDEREKERGEPYKIMPQHRIKTS